MIRFLRALTGAAVDFWRKGCSTLAASVAFFSLLSFFPAAFLLLHLLGYFVGGDQDRYDFLLRLVRGFFPNLGGSGTALLSEIRRMSSGLAVRWAVLAAFAWSAMQVFSELDHAINTVFGDPRSRNPIVSNVVSMGLLILAQLLLIAAYATVQIFGLAITYAPQFAGLDMIAAQAGRFMLRRVLPPMLVLAAATLIYRYVPRSRPSWRRALTGALAFASLWEAARYIFARYVLSSTHYGRMYGSLLVVVLSLLWTYYSAALLLYGAAVVNRFGASRKSRSR